MFDALIIGSGVMGCSIALALSRKVFRTLNIDKAPAAGYGSTSYSAGIIRPYYSSIEGTALAYEGHFVWQEWRSFLQLDAAAPVARYVECGCLVLMPPGSERLVKTTRVLSAVGVPFEIIEPDALGTLLPSPDIRSFAPVRRTEDDRFGEANGASLEGGLFTPAGGYVIDPQLACRDLEQASRLLGATYRFNAEIVEIRQAQGKVQGVRLSDGTTLDAPVVVNAAGPHSARVNELAGVAHAYPVRTRALRQEVVQSSLASDARLPCVVTDPDCGVYLRPDSGNQLLIGSLEPPCDPLHWVDDPDQFDSNVSDQSTTQLWRAAQRLPTLRVSDRAAGIAALYDVSNDWIPIYDRSDLEGFFMAIGTSGNQFKNAPLVGEMMAGLIEYCASGGRHDSKPYEYPLRHLDRSISLGFFSRTRPVHAQSSFTVLG